MAYRVRTEGFEGPFDLLLYLVSRQRIDIGSISISEIADQYLDEVRRMQKLDLDVASDFLVVASTLLEIKAASLIPHEQDADPDRQEIEELAPGQAREVLLQRLLTYKQFKNAAAALENRYELTGRSHVRSFGPPAEFLNLYPDYLERVSLDSLGYLCEEALTRRDEFLLESDHIAAKPIPVESVVRGLHARLKNEHHLRFSQLVDAYTPTPVVVVSFLALLELFKRNMVTLRQDENFGDISIDWKEGSGGLSLEGEDAITSVS
jgi:segregation and condensation protein A